MPPTVLREGKRKTIKAFSLRKNSLHLLRDRQSCQHLLLFSLIQQMKQIFFSSFKKALKTSGGIENTTAWKEQRRGRPGRSRVWERQEMGGAQSDSYGIPRGTETDGQRATEVTEHNSSSSWSHSDIYCE